MGLTQQQGFAALPFMILCGSLCGLFYDGIRFIRVLIGVSSCGNTANVLRRSFLSPPYFHPIKRVQNIQTRAYPLWIRRILLALGDVVNGVFFGCLFSIFLAHYAYGVFRWFFLVASVFGFFMYYATVGRVVMMCMSLVVTGIRAMLCFILWLFILPFRVLGKVFLIAGVTIMQHIIRPLIRRMMFWHGMRYTEKCKRELAETMNLFFERGE